METHFLIRYLTRLPLGTPYPEVVQRVGEVTRELSSRTREDPTLYLDATGLGQPIVDLLREAKIPARIRPVYFTHGDQRKEEGGNIRLGKAFLVSRLQALLQTARIHLPHTFEAEALARELLDYEIRVEADANDRYGAFKVGTR